MSAPLVLTLRNVLPVVTSVVATLFLATAVPHELAVPPEALSPMAPAGLGAELLVRADDARRASR